MSSVLPTGMELYLGLWNLVDIWERTIHPLVKVLWLVWSVPQWWKSTWAGGRAQPFWMMYSVPQWQKSTMIGDGCSAAAGTSKSWDCIFLSKDHGGQKVGGMVPLLGGSLTHSGLCLLLISLQRREKIRFADIIYQKAHRSRSCIEVEIILYIWFCVLFFILKLMRKIK